jgi:hypothetical protein
MTARRQPQLALAGEQHLPGFMLMPADQGVLAVRAEAPVCSGLASGAGEAVITAGVAVFGPSALLEVPAAESPDPFFCGGQQHLAQRELLEEPLTDRVELHYREGAVLDQVQKLLATPDLTARTWAAAKRQGDGEITEREVTVLLADFATVWSGLFPAEQTRIVQLLVERVDLQEDALEVRIRAEGLASLVGELREQSERMAA